MWAMCMTPRPRCSAQWGRFVRPCRVVQHRGDLILFCQALLSGKLLQKETLLVMGDQPHLQKLEGEEAAGSLGGYTQSLGYLCFAKHPVQRYSEVPAL